jgi:low affinity Fe/Cu permease
VFEAIAQWCATVTGSAWYFALFVVGTVACLCVGWWRKQLSFWMLVWTTALTVTTQLQTVLIQNTQNRDTEEMKSQLEELGRATPGAKDVIR